VAVSRVVRLATWNVQHGHPDPDALGAAVASLAADVVSLQEVDRFTGRVGGRDLLARAAEASGLVAVDGHVVRFDGGTYGNALLVHPDLLDTGGSPQLLHRPWWPPWRRPEPRGCVAATLRGGLVVVGAHLGLRRRSERSRQLDGLLRAAGEGPAVVLADLNALPDEVRPHADRHRFTMVDVPAAFPASAPRAVIDHVLVRGVTARPCPDAGRPVVSDHRPVLVELDYLRSASPRL